MLSCWTVVTQSAKAKLVIEASTAAHLFDSTEGRLQLYVPEARREGIRLVRMAAGALLAGPGRHPQADPGLGPTHRTTNMHHHGLGSVQSEPAGGGPCSHRFPSRGLPMDDCIQGGLHTHCTNCPTLHCMATQLLIRPH